MKKNNKFPTPCAADGKDQASGDLYAAINNVGRQRERRPQVRTTGKAAAGGQRRGQLTDPDMGVIQDGGQLNPDWVEWLMGWPIGLTDLKPLEMDRFQQWWLSHGKRLEDLPKFK